MPPAAEHPETRVNLPCFAGPEDLPMDGSGPSSGPSALPRQYGSVCSPLPEAREQVIPIRVGSQWLDLCGWESAEPGREHQSRPVAAERTLIARCSSGAALGHLCPADARHRGRARDNRAVQPARSEGSTATRPPPASLHLGQKALVRLGRLCQRYWRSRSASRSIRSKGWRHDPYKEERHG